MSDKSPKNQRYSRNKSADSSVVCSDNDGESSLPKKKFKHSQEASKAKLPSTKTLMKTTEQTEGVQYQPETGSDIDIDDLEKIQNTPPLPDVSNFVFFYLERPGFGNSADILQIAAKCGEYTFCEYANPTQPVDSRATAVTGLRNVDGELFRSDKRVQSIPIQEVLHKFIEWLAVLKPCILVAHNAKYETPRLLQAFKENSMIEDAKNVIDAFADTLVPLRKLHPQRKGRGMFWLSTLAVDLLHILPNSSFHEASYDVDILEKIASTIPKKDLIANSKSFMEYLVHEARLQRTAVLERSLDVFKGVFSSGMIRRIASAGIGLDKLKKIYAESGREGIQELLSANQKDGTPRVTKNKRILEDFLNFFETIQSSSVV